MAQEKRVVIGMIDNLILQSKVWSRLVSAKQNGRIANAYLFHGPAGSGKEAHALLFSELLNCPHTTDFPCGACQSCKQFSTLQHPNLTIVVPLPKDKEIGDDEESIRVLSETSYKTLVDMISDKAKNPYLKIQLPKAKRILIASIREVRRKAHLAAMVSGQKMICIFDAHKLMAQQGESGNALLKILEEPPPQTTFVLVTDFADQLAPTIRSRCQEISFSSPKSEELVDHFEKCFQLDEAKAILLAQLCGGNVGLGEALVDLNVDDMLEQLRESIRSILNPSSTSWKKWMGKYIGLFRSDPTLLSIELQLLMIWFRDAMILQKFDGSADVMLVNQKDFIQSYVKKFPDADNFTVIQKLSLCADDLSRNYSVNLVMMNLLLDIQQSVGVRIGERV